MSLKCLYGCLHGCVEDIIQCEIIPARIIKVFFKHSNIVVLRALLKERRTVTIASLYSIILRRFADVQSCVLHTSEFVIVNSAYATHSLL